MAINYIENGIGMHDYIVSQGQWLHEIAGVWTSSNDAVVQSIINSYAGSPQELTRVKSDALTQLGAYFDANFDIGKFIKAGTASGITGAQIGNFLATITNNYRTLKASITNAANVTAVQTAVGNITTGWPVNP